MLLRAGDHHAAGAIDKDRLRWDELNPTWPKSPGALFAGGEVPEAPIWSRFGEVGPNPFTEAPAVSPQRRPATFDKPAGALRVGDYLQTQASRYPAESMGFDEGFWRVERVAHLEGAALQSLLAELAWARGKATLANVYGIAHVLVEEEQTVAVVTGDLLKRPTVVAQVRQEDRVRALEELTLDDPIAATVTTGLLRRPDVAFRAIIRTTSGVWSPYCAW
ncbi:DUF6192 family protein [Streptomyces sp. NPDC012746]|uniref:DUF6192 family protein n=1 Tax=Streptomyces sp. NPDC012746 TaxID=3364845 RepID=UPI0036CFD514